jgi:ribosomal protein L40E
MRGPSVRGVTAEYIIVFALGIIFFILGIYGVYYLLAVELPSGYFSKLPFAAIGAIILGLLMIRQTYPIFFPLPKSSAFHSKVCPSCGALVNEDTEVCEKCKRQLDDK